MEFYELLKTSDHEEADETLREMDRQGLLRR